MTASFDTSFSKLVNAPTLKRDQLANYSITAKLISEMPDGYDVWLQGISSSTLLPGRSAAQTIAIVLNEFKNYVQSIAFALNLVITQDNRFPNPPETTFLQIIKGAPVGLQKIFLSLLHSIEKKVATILDMVVTNYNQIDWFDDKLTGSSQTSKLPKSKQRSILKKELGALTKERAAKMQQLSKEEKLLVAQDAITPPNSRLWVVQGIKSMLLLIKGLDMRTSLTMREMGYTPNSENYLGTTFHRGLVNNLTTTAGLFGRAINELDLDLIRHGFPPKMTSGQEAKDMKMSEITNLSQEEAIQIWLFFLVNLYSEELVVSYILDAVKPFLAFMRDLHNQFSQYRALAEDVSTTTSAKPKSLTTTTTDKIGEMRTILNTTREATDLFTVMVLPAYNDKPNFEYTLFEDILTTAIKIIEMITKNHNQIDWSLLESRPNTRAEMINANLNADVLNLVSQTIGHCYMNR